MNDLDAIHEITQLKYRYLRTLDTKAWAEFEDCFVPDATSDYAGLRFVDRASLVGYLRDHLGPDVVTLHQCHHPEIDVDGDTATGVWYLQDRVLAIEHRFVLEGAAFYEDRYVRTRAGWLIAHTGYTRTFEASYSMDAIGGFTLKT
jgi:hypothetical protein